MPFSDPQFDDVMDNLFKIVPYNHYLDIGCGAGKTAQLIRQNKPAADILGYEIDASYIPKYNLKALYTNIVNEDALNIMKNVRSSTEMVIFGDVIEHMRKSDGIDLLHFLVYRSKFLAIRFPHEILQNDWEGHISEAHVSVWNQQDFVYFDHSYSECEYVRLALVKGYLSSPEEFEQIINKLGLVVNKAFKSNTVPVLQQQTVIVNSPAPAVTMPRTPKSIKRNRAWMGG